ncbi:MAG: SRPBCC family protein [Bacteroidota bacterium]
MITTPDFTTTLLVERAPKEVFQAINNVRGWWSEEIEGSTDKLDSEFTYRYKDVHQCKIKLIEFVPHKKVVWVVLDNYFNFTQDRHEWKNTRIVFEISMNADKTELRFTHQGLVPEYECYDICKDGWNNYIHNSLHDLITIGKGKPNPKSGGFNEWLIEQHGIDKNNK